MRNLTAGALAKIAETHGNEPINIIEVQWAQGGPVVQYADRTIGSIPGKILNLDELDNVVNVAGNGQSQEIRITLDDVDGSLKAILNTNDIHQRNVWVYQYFHSMALSDKFLLFKGQVSSPITYSEGERSLTFNVVSQIEDTDIGFSADEGEFDFVSDDLIGQAWPMCFGTVVQGKTLRLSSVFKGIAASSVGVADFCLPYRRSALLLLANFWGGHAANYAIAANKHQQFANHYLDLASGLDPVDDAAEISTLEQLATDELSIRDNHLQNAEQFQQQSNDYAQGAADTLTAYNAQLATQPASFRVIGGETFPRGPIKLKIDQTIFHGSFATTTDLFNVSQVIHPKDGTFAIDNVPLEVPQLPGVRVYSVSLDDTRVTTPSAYEGGLGIEFFLFDSFPPQILNQYSIQMFGEHAGYLFHEAGSVVELYTGEEQEYIVSIIPGEVLSVSAFLTKNGVKKLATVPAEYYEVINRDYGGGLNAVILRMDNALSKIKSTKVADGGLWNPATQNITADDDTTWEDELFVTFESDVGPNTVDVLEYLIETFTDFSTDTASFDAVRTALTNYPSHFQITDRKQVLQALSEISWQARCALWLSNDVFFIRYLPAVPASVSTFTDADIDFGTMELSFTPTENIITKMICKWRASGAQDKDNTIILQHNVKKYGTKEKSFDFYIYNAKDFVIKSATFWLVRYANTWKKLKFQTPLHKLNVESLDGITINLGQPWIANAPVIGVVEQANYDSSSQQLAFEVWTPVRAGEMAAYDFAHPADISTTLTFPTNAEELLDLDGGVSPWKEAGGGKSVGIPGNFQAEYTNPDFYNLLNRKFNDRGQRIPSDANDGPPGDPVVEETANLTYTNPAGQSPVANNVTPTPQIATPPATIGSGGGSLSELLFSTPIIDDVTDPDNPIETTLGDILIWDEDNEQHAARMAYYFED